MSWWAAALLIVSTTASQLSLSSPEHFDLLYVPTIDGVVHALDGKTGSVLWTLGTGGSAVRSGTTVWKGKNMTFIPELNGDLYGSFNDSEDIFKFPMTTWQVVEKSPFVTADGILFMGEKRTSRFNVDAGTGEGGREDPDPFGALPLENDSAASSLPSLPAPSSPFSTPSPPSAFAFVAEQAGFQGGEGWEEERERSGECGEASAGFGECGGRPPKFGTDTFLEVIRSNFSVSARFGGREGEDSTEEREVPPTIDWLSYSVTQFDFFFTPPPNMQVRALSSVHGVLDTAPSLESDNRRTLRAKDAVSGEILWSTLLSDDIALSPHALISPRKDSSDSTWLFGPVAVKFDHPDDREPGTQEQPHLFLGLAANGEVYARSVGSDSCRHPISISPLDSAFAFYQRTKAIDPNPPHSALVPGASSPPPPSSCPTCLAAVSAHARALAGFYLPRTGSMGRLRNSHRSSMVVGLVFGVALTLLCGYYRSYFFGLPDPTDSVRSSTTEVVVYRNHEDPWYERTFEELPWNNQEGQAAVLGQGGSGTVVRVRHRLDGAEYAIKKVPLAGLNPDERKQVYREARFLARLVHPHIVRYHESWDGSGLYEHDHDDDGFDSTQSVEGSGEGRDLREEKDTWKVLNRWEDDSRSGTSTTDAVPSAKANDEGEGAEAQHDDDEDIDELFPNAMIFDVSVCASSSSVTHTHGSDEDGSDTHTSSCSSSNTSSSCSSSRSLTTHTREDDGDLADCSSPSSALSSSLSTPAITPRTRDSDGEDSDVHTSSAASSAASTPSLTTHTHDDHNPMMIESGSTPSSSSPSTPSTTDTTDSEDDDPEALFPNPMMIVASSTPTAPAPSLTTHTHDLDGLFTNPMMMVDTVSSTLVEEEADQTSQSRPDSGQGKHRHTARPPPSDARPLLRSKHRQPPENESGDDDQRGLVTRPSSSSHRRSPGRTRGRRTSILYIQMQLCDSTLGEWMEDPQRQIDCAHNRLLFRQITAGLAYVHKTGIIHRDLKPANIFLMENAVVRIGDFGLSKAVSGAAGDSGHGEEEAQRIHSVGLGSPYYCSPEQLHGGGDYCRSSDIFSLGMILCEMYCKFGSGSERLQVMAAIREGDLDAVKPHMDLSGRQLAASLLCKDPAQRPSAESILASEWVSKKAI